MSMSPSARLGEGFRLEAGCPAESSEFVGEAVAVAAEDRLGFSGDADFVEEEKETVFCCRDLLFCFKEVGFSQYDEDCGEE